MKAKILIGNRSRETWTTGKWAYSIIRGSHTWLNNAVYETLDEARSAARRVAKQLNLEVEE